MKLSFGSLEPAIFVKRDNRFRAEIEIEGKRYKAHVANSGRMAELLVTGAAALGAQKFWILRGKRRMIWY